MPKRKPRVVGKRRSEEGNIRRAEQVIWEGARSYRPRVKSRREEVFDVIYDACRRGYHFTDHYYGIPFIELSDVEEAKEGIFVVRFRCEPKYLHEVYFGQMAKDVCKELRSELRFIHERKQEWGIPFEECVWVLHPGEIKEQKPFYKEFYDIMSQQQENPPQTKPSPKKCTHERWNDFLGAKYGRTLLDVASELGYSDENLEMLACDKNDKNAKFQLYKKHKSLFDAFLKTDCADLRDGRNPLDYFKDLIASWVGEDLLVRALNEYGLKAEVANADKDRKIKESRRQITCAADIKLEYEGNVRFVELMDALSPVEEYGQFDLRLSKAKKQFEHGNIFLLQCLTDGKFVLIDFLRDSITVKYNAPHPRWGGKSSSLVNLEENGIKMRPMALLWETIKGIMQNTKPESAHTLTMVDVQTGKTETLTSGAVIDDDSSDYSESGDDCPSENEEPTTEIRQAVDEKQEADVSKPEPENLPVVNPEESSVDLSDISDESEEQSLESDGVVVEEEAAPPSQEEEQPPQEDEGFIGGDLGDLSNFC